VVGLTVLPGGKGTPDPLAIPGGIPGGNTHAVTGNEREKRPTLTGSGDGPHSRHGIHSGYPGDGNAPAPSCEYPWRCLACSRTHRATAVCRELRDAWWSFVRRRDAPTRAKSWARAALGLDEAEYVPPTSRPVGHVHGWGRSASGEWRCVQDYYANGSWPGTGCGESWEAARPAA
jgi:hypothetical protein